VKKGEVWLVDLPEGKGHEQKGIRPALVLGIANNLTIIAPFTKNTDCLRFDYTGLIEPTQDNGLTEQSVVLAFHISSLDPARFIRQLGWIHKEQRNVVDGLLKTLLKID